MIIVANITGPAMFRLNSNVPHDQLAKMHDAILNYSGNPLASVWIVPGTLSA